MQQELRKLPSIEKFLQQAELVALSERYGRELVLEAIRGEADQARQLILAGQPAPSLDALTQGAISRLTKRLRPSLQPVINATGVIIHTNLGRAILSDRARQAMLQAASAYSNLEYDLPSGTRGSRYGHAAELLSRLSGAEAALVVNNNAGAVMLALTALAKDKEVIISRGQLVEIGGGFRIPDIMAQSGARLVEVGSTNRTYLRDFAAAIKPDLTGMLLAVHSSNYQVVGFTAQPTLAELASLGRQQQILTMEDLGSGTLLDTTPFGLAHEPTIQESVAAGVDLITASGDKLLGGPQAGLIFGRADLIQRLQKHPLMRALRVDKTTLAALQATLFAYLENKAVEEIPVWRMIAADQSQLARRARRWQRYLKRLLVASPEIQLDLVATNSTVGGGSLPGQTLPSQALAITAPGLTGLAEQLRQATPPLIARIEAEQLRLDPRTVLPEQDKRLLSILSQALSKPVTT
jgi:L-seryl-tRNA(Ser) seleniumtransferase